MPTTAVPLLLTDPGYLLWAPVLTAFPTNTVVASVFTDAWAGAYISLGATEDGSEFTYATKLEAVMVAEFFDPIRWSTTERSGSFAFTLVNWTLTQWKKAMNGGTLTIVSGTTTTTLTSFTPPAPGGEVRATLGWESTDATTRLLVPQCINGTEIKSKFAKAPAKAGIACEFQFEIPTSTFPFTLFSAGVARG